MKCLNFIWSMFQVSTNYIGLAKLLNVYANLRHVKITDDPFDDTVQVRSITQFHFLAYFYSQGSVQKTQLLFPNTPSRFVSLVFKSVPGPLRVHT